MQSESLIGLAFRECGRDHVFPRSLGQTEYCLLTKMGMA